MSEERKIRIVHIAQSPGGVERYLRSLLKYSNREKYEIILIVSNQYKRKNYVNLVDAFENVDMIRSIDPKSDLNAIKAIRKLLKKYKPDIVYCHSSKAGALGRIANMGLKNKCVYNPHGWAFNMRGNKLKKLIYVGIEKVLAPFCSTIICISGAEKRSALKYRICGKKKLKVIYNGIDFDEYNMDYHMNTRELLEIPEDAFVVGMVGRLAEQKAPDVFVKAAKRIKEIIPKAFFLIVGDGPDWDEVQQEVDDNELTDSFILAGWTRRPMEYIKIVFIINSLKNGGPVNMLYTLIKHVDANKFDMYVIALNKCDPNNERNFNELSCKVVTLSDNENTMKQVNSLIEKINPDIVHSHGGRADLVNSRLKGNFKTVSTVHCDPDEDFAMKKGKIRGWMQATVFINTLKKIQCPIACSETVAKKIEHKRHLNIGYIRNGIDLNRLNINEETTRSELGIGTEDIVLSFCGYLSKRKNTSYLINAIKKISRKDIFLLLIGDGKELEDLKKLAGNDRRIKFIGRVPSPIKYLRISDYFVSASLSEGLPLAVMEGMGCGLPAILSNIDSHFEMKKCCEEAVQIFDLEDYEKMIAILNNLERDENKSKAAQKVVFDYLNATRMAKEYENVYSED